MDDSQKRPNHLDRDLRSSLATACVQGAVSALDKFFNAANARQGGTAAVAELEAIQQDCQSASGG